LYSEVGNDQVQAASVTGGVAESSASTEAAFISFCAARLNVTVNPADISVCHRLRKPQNGSQSGNHPAVLLRFTNRKVRASVLAARKRLRTTSSSSVTNAVYGTSTSTLPRVRARYSPPQENLSGTNDWRRLGHTMDEWL
jgi:hypothetical protein